MSCLILEEKLLGTLVSNVGYRWGAPSCQCLPKWPILPGPNRAFLVPFLEIGHSSHLL